MKKFPIQTNFQPIEKRVHSDGSSLDVHSTFLTIQGEGPFTGRRAVFVRLAGCNLQCPLCDTEYTNGRKKAPTEELVRDVLTLWNDGFNPYRNHEQEPLVVITGGEPFRQNLTHFVTKLLNSGFSVQVETNGTLKPPEGLSEKVAIVVSPKAGRMNEITESRSIAYKYVLGHDSVDTEDGLPIKALDHSIACRVARPRFQKPIYLQPRDDKDVVFNRMNVKAVVESALKFGYIVQLQTHKYLEVE